MYKMAALGDKTNARRADQKRATPKRFSGRALFRAEFRFALRGLLYSVFLCLFCSFDCTVAGA